MPSNHITLFVSGLHTAPIVPADLARLLARADISPVTADGAILRLFNLFGIRPDATHDLPIAAITQLADMGGMGAEWWIRADPVHLEPSRDGLIMRHPVELTGAESAALVSELNDSLTSEGWRLHAPHPQRWYLKFDTEPNITTTLLDQTIGQDVHTLLPQGADRRLWHTRLNEIQILLHGSPVNAAREARGLLPVNSVWFWGGGQLPRSSTPPWSAVWADDPLTVGLARLTNIPAQPLSAREEGGQELIVSDCSADPGATEKLITIIVEALHAGRCSALTVVTDTGPAYRYLPRHRWRLWRRSRQASRLPEHS